MQQFCQRLFRIALRTADREPLLFTFEVTGVGVRLIPEVKNDVPTAFVACADTPAHECFLLCERQRPTLIRAALCPWRGHNGHMPCGLNRRKNVGSSAVRGFCTFCGSHAARRARVPPCALSHVAPPPAVAGPCTQSGVLGIYATSSGCCVSLHRPPKGMELSRISAYPARPSVVMAAWPTAPPHRC
jgi:hypothetical protein